MTSTSEHIDGLEEVKDPEISTTNALVEASAKNGGGSNIAFFSQIRVVKLFSILFLFSSVNLVERNPAPGGFPLVDPDRVGKKTQIDPVELASQIQTVRKYAYCFFNCCCCCCCSSY